MRGLSRLLATEATLTDRYMEWSQQGKAFVIAYSATEREAEEIAKLLLPFHPLAAQWFSPAYIQSLF